MSTEQSRDGIGQPWGTRTPYGPGEPWPVRVDDRVNHGRLDPKDLFAWQANHAPDRLTVPLVRDGGVLVESTWDDAMTRIVNRGKELLDEQGSGALGCYTCGQLFAEEY